MANSKIKAIQVKNGTFNRQIGSSHSMFIKQVGKVVMISGYVQGLSLTANTETALGTFSGVDYPENIVRTFCAISTQAYIALTNMGYLYVNTAGRIGFSSPISGSQRVIYFTVVYTTN